MGKQQLVEIAKALSKEVQLLILDEPTAALNEDDSENLLELLLELKKLGVTCIMISHKLKEVIHVADTVTVLRDGKTICSMSREKGEINEQVIIKHMVGRAIEDIFPKRHSKNIGDILLETKDLTAFDKKLGRNVIKTLILMLEQERLSVLQVLWVLEEQNSPIVFLVIIKITHFLETFILKVKK